MSRTIEPTALSSTSAIHDVDRTRSGSSTRDNSSNFVENFPTRPQLYRTVRAKSRPDVLAAIQRKLAGTTEEQVRTDQERTLGHVSSIQYRWLVQWQAWRILYCAIRDCSELEVPAAVIDQLVNFLRRPVLQPLDMIPSEVNAYVMSARHITKAGHAVEHKGFKHNLSAKLGGQLLSILLVFSITGSRRMQQYVNQAGGLELLQDIAIDSVSQSHVAFKNAWLLRPMTKLRIDQLLSLIPLAIMSIHSTLDNDTDADPAARQLKCDDPHASPKLVAALNQHFKFLHRAVQPRDKGGIENPKGMSFGDLVSKPMTDRLCAALTAELAAIDSSCSPAANYVRTILLNWSLSLGKPATTFSGDALYWLFEDQRQLFVVTTTERRSDKQLPEEPGIRSKIVAVLGISAAAVILAAIRSHAKHCHVQKKSLQPAVLIEEKSQEVEYGQSLEKNWWHERH